MQEVLRHEERSWWIDVCKPHNGVGRLRADLKHGGLARSTARMTEADTTRFMLDLKTETVAVAASLRVGRS